jgi:hypothetical protein
MNQGSSEHICMQIHKCNISIFEIMLYIVNFYTIFFKMQ